MASFAAVARMNKRSIASELRLVAAEHVSAHVRSLNEGELEAGGSKLSDRRTETADRVQA